MKGEAMVPLFGNQLQLDQDRTNYEVNLARKFPIMAKSLNGGYMRLVITDIDAFRKIASTSDKTDIFGKSFEKQRSEF